MYCFRSDSIRVKNGFTLVEVLIALGLISILAVTGMNIASVLQKSTEYGGEAQSALRLAATVRDRLKYGDLCQQSIGPDSLLNQNNINRAQFRNGNKLVEIKIPSINAGPLGNEDIIRTGQVIPSLKLRIDDLRFTNVENVSGDTYVAEIQLTASSLNRRAFKPMKIMSVLLTLTGPQNSSSIATCAGPDSNVPMNICQDMGCNWETVPTPGCKCETISSLCPVGEYPVEFQPTGPVCKKLGGVCPAGEYLVGVGIDSNVCAPIAGAPPPTPTPVTGNYTCSVFLIPPQGGCVVCIATFQARCTSPSGDFASGIPTTAWPGPGAFSYSPLDPLFVPNGRVGPTGSMSNPASMSPGTRPFNTCNYVGLVPPTTYTWDCN